MSIFDTVRKWLDKYSYKQVTWYAFLCGCVYFYLMESTIPKSSNCSYVSSVATDVGAFIVGGAIAYIAKERYDDKLLYLFGVGIVVEHILQMFGFKIRLFRRKK